MLVAVDGVGREGCADAAGVRAVVTGAFLRGLVPLLESPGAVRFGGSAAFDAVRRSLARVLVVLLFLRGVGIVLARVR